MNRWIIIIVVVVVLAICAADAFAQFGAPFGKLGPYEKYDMGYDTIAAGDSLIFAAPTHWRITCVTVRNHTNGDSLILRFIMKEPYGTGATVSRDEEYLVQAAAAKTQDPPRYAVADTVILRGEKAAEVKWTYFIGYTYYGPRREVGSAP